MDKDVELDEPPVVPRTFHQLGILILDGSGSMGDLTASKISKADAVNHAVQELLGRLKNSRVKKNFSVAVITFDNSATLHTQITPVEQADDFGDYNPIAGHGDGTDIGVGLQTAKGVAQQFLSETNRESVPRSVVIVVMSDGMSGGDPLTIADQLKQEPRIKICTTLFSAVGEDVVEAQQLLRDIASSPLDYRTTYNSDDLRKFFIASISSGKNVKIT